MPDKKSPVVPLYGVTIHHCIAGGDLQKMKSLCAKADCCCGHTNCCN